MSSLVHGGQSKNNANGQTITTNYKLLLQIIITNYYYKPLLQTMEVKLGQTRTMLIDKLLLQTIATKYYSKLLLQPTTTDYGGQVGPDKNNANRQTITTRPVRRVCIT